MQQIREAKEGKVTHLSDMDSDDVQRFVDEAEGRLFSKEIIEEARNPHNMARLEDFDGKGVEEGLCGDSMEFYIKVDSGKISRASFFTDGCGPTIACGSRLTRYVKGSSIAKAQEFSPSSLEKLLGGLPDDHRHCAALAVASLRKAIRDYLNRQRQDPTANTVKSSCFHVENEVKK